MRDKQELKYAVDDSVRILKRKQKFDRGYDVRYSIKVFKIDKIEGFYYVLDDGRKFREGSLQKVMPVREANKMVQQEEKKSAEIKDVTAVKPPLAPGRVRSPSPEKKEPARSSEGRYDVAREAKFNHKTDQILKFKEGIDLANRRQGLRERKPQSQLEHSLFGKINW